MLHITIIIYCYILGITSPSSLLQSMLLLLLSSALQTADGPRWITVGRGDDDDDDDDFEWMEKRRRTTVKNGNGCASVRFGVDDEEKNSDARFHVPKPLDGVTVTRPRTCVSHRLPGQVRRDDRKWRQVWRPSLCLRR